MNIWYPHWRTFMCRACKVQIANKNLTKAMKLAIQLKSVEEVAFRKEMWLALYLRRSVAYIR